MSQTIPPKVPVTADSLKLESDAGSLQKDAALRAIYEPIESELKSVEKILHAELASDAPWIDELLNHSRLVGGKRMRPVFLLLSGACCGKLGTPHFNMAAALEMIHTATLIHDDVLDRAETRRHLPTANSKWGNKVSVLLGDYLFTHAFHVASHADSMVALRELAAASNKVCAGEMRQNAWVGNFELEEDKYFAMISDKTAELCRVGCHLGAILSGANEATAKGFEQFGLDIGIAFQIIDDVLDLVGHPSKVGKTLGTDIANGKPTLPIIHALANLETKRSAELLKLLNSKEATAESVLPFLAESSSIDYARETAEAFGQRAAKFANGLPDSPYSKALQTLAQFVLLRNH